MPASTQEAGSSSITIVNIPPTSNAPTTIGINGRGALTPDPYRDLTGPKLDMRHLGGAGNNKNKRKAIHDMAHVEAKRTIFFDDPQRAPGLSAQVPQAASAPLAKINNTPSSAVLTLQRTTSPHAATPVSVQKKKGGHIKIAEKRCRPPSERRDLPKNVRVTFVDVESSEWQPGPGQVVEGTSMEWSSATAPPNYNYQESHASIVDNSISRVAESWVARDHPEWKDWWPKSTIEALLQERTLPVLAREHAKNGQHVVVKASSVAAKLTYLYPHMSEFGDLPGLYADWR